MVMKDYMGNISDDAEFDDLEDFDYVDQFGGQDDDSEDSRFDDDDLDDLDDLYVDEKDGLSDDDEDDIFDEMDEDDLEDEESSEIISNEIDDVDEELEVKLICEDCGHKWMDLVSETEEENDLFEINCPMCGSSNVSMQR